MAIWKLNNNSAKRDRPRLELSRSRLEYALEILSAVGLIIGLYSLLVSYETLPASIPVHYNLRGEVDSWGDKSTIWILGVIMIVVYGALTLTAKIPHLYNYPFSITAENAERQYRIARTFITLLKTEIVWLFAAIICGTMEVALGVSNQLHPLYSYFFLALIALTTAGYFVLSYRAR